MPGNAPFFFFATIGSLVEAGQERWLSNLRLGESYRYADEGEHQAVLGEARYIISLFPVMNASSESGGLEQPGPRSVLPTAWCWRGGCLPSHVSLSAWRQGEQESPRADVQMETERVPPKGLPGLASAMPRLPECGRWLSPESKRDPAVARRCAGTGDGAGCAALCRILYHLRAA